MKKNKPLILLLCCCLFSAGSVPAAARTGVAFVHGKGGTDLAQPSVARAYWTEDMIRATTKNYAIPHIVCHYDGTRYMWVAADQVAAQLDDFITRYGITDLVINTHSFGGVVVRWIFSNPEWNGRYPNIIRVTRWVNTIAAPQSGSEAADLAGTLEGSWLTGWLVDLVGQSTDSTRNLRTDAMAYYNQYWLDGTAGRPALPRPFYWISGYGLWNDYWWTFHYEDIGLATLSGIVGLPGEDDGMVAEYSQQAVGYRWFRTDANHHHNRRNDFRKIGDALATDF
ncbi:MAG TPA: hypothetical protein VNL72_03155 [Gammaproteobacteria bacterium]|nr:hypothetical protein [Gammaproteobacteria bacterium]